ncbi:MAG: hypothetical protein JNM55_23515 [Anaerolineales bacterium]|nr:hypothetical protein [Anaerolineales bacterium]
MFLITSCVSAPGTVVSPALTNTEVVVATPPNLEVSIDQPEWMKNPNSDILLLSYGVNAVFFDAGTASTLYMALPNARWVDNNHVLFTAFDQAYSNVSEKTYKYALDIADWKIVEAKYISDIVGKDGDTPNVFVDKDEENTPLKIYNKQLEQWENFLYPPQGLFNLNELLIGNRIFVVQGEDINGNGDMISVYDLETKEAVKTFLGNVGMNILRYSKGKVVYIVDNVPCAIDVQILERECGTPIPEKYVNVEIDQTLNYPDVIPFIYEDHLEKNIYNKRICIYAFFDGEIACPMDNLKILNPVVDKIPDLQDSGKLREVIELNSVWAYSISPDTAYVLFCYGNNNYAQYQGTAIIDIDGGNLRILDDIEFIPDVISYMCQDPRSAHVASNWRPVP